MMMDDERRWEHGSDFAYPEIGGADDGDSSWLPSHASYWHSGRHAFRALVHQLKPRRVLFPSFYCQDVLDAATPLEVCCYGDGPNNDDDIDGSSLDLRADDLIVVTNTYGLRRRSPLRSVPNNVIVVEDHTHNPLSRWARTSTAPYAFASLRKWFPLPDGGMIWSPQSLPLVDAPPFNPHHEHAEAAAITLDRLSGMLLKQRYLAGEEAIVKDEFRARSVGGEEAIGRGEPMPMSPLSRALLNVLPATKWHTKRSSNHRHFVEALGSSLPSTMSVMSTPTSDDAPFAIVLLCSDAAEREALRALLVRERVYPAVLWPIDGTRAPGIPDAHVQLSRRLLCLHCDHRYEANDIERVAKIVQRSVIASVASQQAATNPR